jgi:hypothetical protein
MDPDPGGPKNMWILRIRIRNNTERATMKNAASRLPDSVEGKRSYSLLAGRSDGTDDLQPRGKALQMPGQKARDGVPIIRPMELGLAQSVQEDEGGGGGGQAAGPLKGGQRAQDALQQGRLRVRHALHKSQPGPATDS